LRGRLFGKDNMNSFMSWVGGKKALREVILDRFPAEYKRYVEVFGGGGWVLFYKPPGSDFEVFNDYNRNLVNLYRCVREHPMQLKDELYFTLNSRCDFEYMKEVLHTQADLPDIRRAAYFYQVLRESYAASMDSFAAQPHSMWKNFQPIINACARLQSVVIENRDFERVIKQYDRPESFFYCDPPYYATEDYYKDVGFGTADHERLADCLAGIQGKFLLSYNDCLEIRSLYDKPGYRIESVERLHNMKQRFSAGEQYPELLISNYDTGERRKMQMQISLVDIFDWEDREQEEPE
jgi:Site-specific DNA methylase